MSNKYDIKTFQGLILTLQDYWASQGLLIVQPFDMEVGAGTSHPMTFLRAIGPIATAEGSDDSRDYLPKPILNFSLIVRAKLGHIG